MVRGIDVAKRTQWRLRLRRFEESDLTVSEFCGEEGVSLASFYYWRRRVGQTGADQSEIECPRGFAAVRIIGAECVTVRLAGGSSVEIAAGDVESLRVVIETLARVEAERAGATPC